MAPPKKPGYARGTQVSTSLTNRETFGGNSKAGLGRHIGMGQFTFTAINNGSSGHNASTVSGPFYMKVKGIDYPINMTNQLSRTGVKATHGMFGPSADGVNKRDRKIDEEFVNDNLNNAAGHHPIQGGYVGYNNDDDLDIYLEDDYGNLVLYQDSDSGWMQIFYDNVDAIKSAIYNKDTEVNSKYIYRFVSQVPKKIDLSGIDISLSDFNLPNFSDNSLNFIQMDISCADPLADPSFNYLIWESGGSLPGTPEGVYNDNTDGPPYDVSKNNIISNNLDYMVNKKIGIVNGMYYINSKKPLAFPSKNVQNYFHVGGKYADNRNHPVGNVPYKDIYNPSQDLPGLGIKTSSSKQLIYFTSENYTNDNPGPYPVEIVDMSYSPNAIGDVFPLPNGGLSIAYRGIQYANYDKYNFPLGPETEEVTSQYFKDLSEKPLFHELIPYRRIGVFSATNIPPKISYYNGTDVTDLSDISFSNGNNVYLFYTDEENFNHDPFDWNFSKFVGNISPSGQNNPITGSTGLPKQGIIFLENGNPEDTIFSGQAQDLYNLYKNNKQYGKPFTMSWGIDNTNIDEKISSEINLDFYGGGKNQPYNPIQFYVQCDTSADVLEFNKKFDKIYYIEGGGSGGKGNWNGGTIVEATNRFYYESEKNYNNLYRAEPSNNIFESDLSINSISDWDPSDNDFTSFYGYLPAKLPGGDYWPTYDISNSTFTHNFPLYLNQQETPFGIINQPKMDSDQCRWCWRLSHFVRANFNVYDISDNDDLINYYRPLIDITKSSAKALVEASKKNGYRLSLGVNIWDISCTQGNSNSADMVPPLLASLNALNYFVEDLSNTEQDYLKYTEGNDPSYVDTEDISKEWPFFDSYNAGGQQIGLAGASMGCSMKFLASSKYNAMKLYDQWNMTEEASKNYNQIITDYNNTVTSAADLDLSCNVIKERYNDFLLRGNGYLSYSDWPKITNADTTAGNFTFADLIGSKAYATNVRIRDINISREDELKVGDICGNYQPLNLPDSSFNFGLYAQDTDFTKYLDSNINKLNLDSSGVKSSWIDSSNQINDLDNAPDFSWNTYVKTYFPIYGIPDQGWGAITSEIFSYQGIAAVLRNDYKFFCRWHRCFYYLLYVQNGGNMYNFNIDPSGDPIYQAKYVNDVSGAVLTWANGSEYYWVPSYLNDISYTAFGDIDGSGAIPFKQVEKLTKNYNIYNNINQYLDSNNSVGWPPDFSGSAIRSDGVDTSFNPNDPTIEIALRVMDGQEVNKKDLVTKTKFWSNRWDPYRGGGAAYGPNNDGQSRTIWSTPSYCMGYSPVWVNGGKTRLDSSSDPKPKDGGPIAEALNPYYSTEAGLYTASDSDQNIFLAYKLAALKWTNDPFDGDGLLNLDDISENIIDNDGYICDLADYRGVLAAYYELPNYKDQQNNGNRESENYEARYPIKHNIFNIIGYGFDLSNNKQLVHPQKGTPVTTWSYMAESIAKTLISNNGLSYTDKDSHGNFAKDATISGKRIITLGHDTGAGPIKLDYIDPQIYLNLGTPSPNTNKLKDIYITKNDSGFKFYDYEKEIGFNSIIRLVITNESYNFRLINQSNHIYNISPTSPANDPYNLSSIDDDVILLKFNIENLLDDTDIDLLFTCETSPEMTGLIIFSVNKKKSEEKESDTTTYTTTSSTSNY